MGDRGNKAMGPMILKLFVVAVIAAGIAHGAQQLLTGETHAAMSGGVAGAVAAGALTMMRRKG